MRFLAAFLVAVALCVAPARADHTAGPNVVLCDTAIRVHDWGGGASACPLAVDELIDERDARLSTGGLSTATRCEYALGAAVRALYAMLSFSIRDSGHLDRLLAQRFRDMARMLLAQADAGSNAVTQRGIDRARAALVGDTDAVLELVPPNLE